MNIDPGHFSGALKRPGSSETLRPQCQEGDKIFYGRSTRASNHTVAGKSPTPSPLPSPTHLRHVDLQHRHDGGVQVVGLRRLGVVDVHGVAPAGYSEDGGKVEILRELLGVQRGAGDEELEVWAEAGNVLRGGGVGRGGGEAERCNGTRGNKRKDKQEWRSFRFAQKPTMSWGEGGKESEAGVREGRDSAGGCAQEYVSNGAVP